MVLFRHYLASFCFVIEVWFDNGGLRFCQCNLKKTYGPPNYTVIICVMDCLETDVNMEHCMKHYKTKAT